MRTHLLKTLPSSLVTILQSSQIIKIGRNIGGDLAKLAREFPEYKLPPKVNKKLPGVIELGAFAKSKNAISEGTASLSAITAAILHADLSKAARESPWNAPSLSQVQKDYAALDAWLRGLLVKQSQYICGSKKWHRVSLSLSPGNSQLLQALPIRRKS
ncbi:hypothetical protein B0H11DRAFT_1916536 [Mycena galericulata]|nr:hypothetical protein B0H11DRAFT_1916536 [Mycena galericulata]